MDQRSDVAAVEGILCLNRNRIVSNGSRIRCQNSLVQEILVVDFCAGTLAVHKVCLHFLNMGGLWEAKE